ncbi:hypothetical protein A2635_01885 [Candidatus Peribacteria bacterium RIFCSPHIGHO2_01_FULL_51_9]|nr:MAG: hypothetical protein A2635_01885 [Candidatus Peribacteria bacterium RIFCSPHIGHO2_01_FULL_51_9]
MEFAPIASYGFIGNLLSCALVRRDGAIDWCCLPAIDSPSVFAAILDPEKGGAFRVTVHGSEGEPEQAYLGETNILRTVFRTSDGGIVELLDWMHMGVFSYVEGEESRLPALFRLVRCLEGKALVTLHFNPRLDYGRTQTVLSVTERGICARSEGDTLCLHARGVWNVGTDGAQATVSLTEGREWSCICHYGSDDGVSLPDIHKSLQQTERYWKRWIAECEGDECPYLGRWQKEAIRSLLALKILAGGRRIAAAATTSLPERIGNGENWDYRFSWVRDTAFTVQAFTMMGHFDDAREFVDWLCELLCEGGMRPADLQVLYPLYATGTPDEAELTHLRGYRDSRPVRIGNAAMHQKQWDIYGEILETIYRSAQLYPGPDSTLRRILIDIVNYVCEIWREPDHGIWELRQGSQHYVYSKVMCWVALDRGIKLASAHQWQADVVRWEEEREALRSTILTEGYNAERQCFRQAFGSSYIDATALLFPLLEFIPADHPFAVNTLETIRKELEEDALVYRSDYHREREGTFIFCSFWLVDALALAGRVTDAVRNFKKLLAHANHLGLYAEEIDPKTGEFLGNFPQAFTHVGLINSAVYLGRSQTEESSEQPLMGEQSMVQ